MNKKRLIIFSLVMLMTFIVMKQNVHAGVGYDGLGPVVLTGKRNMKWPVANNYNIQSCFYDHRDHKAIDISAG